MDRFKYFREKKDIDKDPLVRYCPKAGCDQYIRAEDSQCVKLQCQKCTTEVCFACKQEWHEGVTCEAIMNNQLAGWAELGNSNVSKCPMCKTWIEKNRGCNYMECLFCGYKFCWVCRAGAVHGDDHFRNFLDKGKGCGAKMMDEEAKPGDHLRLMGKREGRFKILKIVLIIIEIL